MDDKNKTFAERIAKEVAAWDAPPKGRDKFATTLAALVGGGEPTGGGGDKGGGSSSASSSAAPILTLIFFIGGCTYAEIAALRWLGRNGTPRREYLIATTHICSGDMLMESLVASCENQLDVGEL